MNSSNFNEWLNLIFRWIHVLAGVMWIGHLWFFNFVNGQVAKTYDDLVKASQDVAKDEMDAVKTAENKFDAAVRAVPDDATLTQAAASLRDDAANVQAAVSDLQTATKC